MCCKKRFDRIGAMIALARCQKARKGKRRERRYYWCGICRAYHLTSQG